MLAEFLDPGARRAARARTDRLPAPDAPLEELDETTARRRVFAGYAGWGEGQLDAEVEQGDWIVHDAAARRTLQRGARGACGRAC